jgi:hypothetical protein
MKYDTLMPKDIEPYLNGRSWEDLKVGDEIAFPEPDSGPTAESLVGLTFYIQQGPDEMVEMRDYTGHACGPGQGVHHVFEMTCTSFNAETGMHAIEGADSGAPQPIDLRRYVRELPDQEKSMITFEGSDAYFAEMLGLCTIGELDVACVAASVSGSFLRCYS